MILRMPLPSLHIGVAQLAWSIVYSDALNCKHQLEDVLLQLGEFHDVLAQILSWIAECTGRLSEAGPPGVLTDTIETQLSDLTVSKQVWGRILTGTRI